MNNILEKDIFCAACQTHTIHKLAVEPKNNEILATCDCGRNLKFPLFNNPADFHAALDAHYKSNEGQVSFEKAKATSEAYHNQLKTLLGVE